MNWKTSLHSVTIRQCKELEDKFRIASEAGYSGMDLMYTDVEDFVQKGHDVRDIVSLMEKHELVITHLGFLGDWQFKNGIPLICRLHGAGDNSQDNLLERSQQFFRNCAVLGCKCAIAIPAIEETGSIDEAVKNYRKLCDLAGEEEINVAFEFIGFARQMRDLKIAWEVVERTNRSNAGILFDTFHFYRGGSKIEHVKSIPKDKIFMVHINDAKDKDRERLTDQDRVIPGQGVVPLKEILGALKEQGYEGYFSVEIFNEDYWQDDPLRIAILAREAIENLFKSV